MQICSISPRDVMLQLFSLRFPFQAFSSSASGGPGPLILFTSSGLIKSQRKTAISSLAFSGLASSLLRLCTTSHCDISEKRICNCKLPGCKPSVTLLQSAACSYFPSHDFCLYLLVYLFWMVISFSLQEVTRILQPALRHWAPDPSENFSISQLSSVLYNLRNILAHSDV